MLAVCYSGATAWIEKLSRFLSYSFYLLLPASTTTSYDLPAVVKMPMHDDEIVDFAVIPVHTMAACDYILDTVSAVMSQYTSTPALSDIAERSQTFSQSFYWKRSWPMIVREKSTIHKTITDIHQLASSFLERFSSFDEKRDDLRMFLNLPQGFSAGGLQALSDGEIQDRNVILLSEDYYWDVFDEQRPERRDSIRKYHSYMLDTLTWMLEDPLKRMVSAEFKGTYLGPRLESISEQPVVELTGKYFHLKNFELSNSLLDTDSVSLGQNTPTTTCAASPALTERQINDYQRNDKPLKPPTLKYIAVIETSMEKALYDLKPNHINGELRKKLQRVKELCEEMVKKGYEDKFKLQDIMDVGMNMANK